VPYEKRVKVMPQTEEFELYNLSDDPMELDNLAGRLQYATTEAALKLALKGEAKTKRLTPTAPAPRTLPPIPRSAGHPYPANGREFTAGRRAERGHADARPLLRHHARNNLSEDQHTRIMLFAMNVELLPDENLSVIKVQAETAQGGTLELPVEYVDKVSRFFWLTQLNVRLPEELENAGDVWVSIKLRGVPSNKALISIEASQEPGPRVARTSQPWALGRNLGWGSKTIARAPLGFKDKGVFV